MTSIRSNHFLNSGLEARTTFHDVRRRQDVPGGHNGRLEVRNVPVTGPTGLPLDDALYRIGISLMLVMGQDSNLDLVALKNFVVHF